jgi:hypothetical protein
MKFTCDNCGAIIESGIVNFADHQFNCGARKTEKVSDFFSITTHPFLKVTPMEEKVLTTEEKIHIAAGFDSEKIKMIRELMEEEVLNYEIWRRKSNRVILDEIGLMPYKATTEIEDVKLYQQTK